MRVGNSGSSGRPSRSLSQRCSSASTGLVRGTARCLRPLPFAGDVGAGAEGDVGAVQAGEFGDSQAGLDGQQHEGAVASAFPAGLVRGGDQGVDLGGGQERHDPLVEPLRRDGQDALDQQGVLGMTQRGVGEQRADRGQSHVACPDAVAPLALEVVQERGDHRGVQVVPVQHGGQLAGLPVHEPEQQPQRVAVGRDGARAGLALRGEPVGEEGLQRRRDQRHDRAADHAVSWRAAASASSSGAAERYQ